MPANWYYKLGPIVVGPMPWKELLRCARERKIRELSLVRRGEDGEWLEARLVPRLILQSKRRTGAWESARQRVASSWRALRERSGRLPAVFSRDLLPNRTRRWAVGSLAVVGILTAASYTVIRGMSGGPDRDDQARMAALASEIDRLRAEVAKSSEANKRQAEIPQLAPPQPQQHVPPPAERRLRGRELVELVEPSVVTLRTQKPQGEIIGSGFVVDELGLIATNYHVIEHARSGIAIFRDGTRMQVQGYVAILPRRDLAILKVELPTGYRRALRLARDDPRAGDSVMAFGAPLGLANSVSEGVVSGVRSGTDVRTVWNTYERDYDLGAKWIQTTAPISGGNSGGPLVDEFGNVIGLNTWTRNGGAQNLNFAISASELNAALASRSVDARSFASLPGPQLQQARLDNPTPTIPLPAPRETSVAPGPVAPAATEQWREKVRLIQRIYEQRLVLLDQWETQKIRLANVQARFAATDGELVRINTEATAMQQRGASLRVAGADLRSAIALARDDQTRAQYQRMLSQVEQTFANCVAYHNSLEAQAARTAVIRNQLQQEAASIQADAAKTSRDSEQLRSEWLTATDAYGHLARGDYSTAVTVFSEWAVLEPSNALPYLARGLAHHNTGNDKLSNEDFNRASRLDPRATAAMIRDIRKADKRK